MKENPWHHLPAEPPFVLPEDSARVASFNKTAGPIRELHVSELLPEPFVGSPDAPVLLLSNNPGYGPLARRRGEPRFMTRMRKNLLHAPADFPFVYLDPEFREHQGPWWKRKLRRLIEQFDERIVANNVLNVAYFPYPSQRFGHQRLRLTSQDYSFDLVRRAIQRGAFIVFMRQRNRWLAEVPELRAYRRQYEVSNVQNPTISRTNCDNPKPFEAVVESIKAASKG